MSEHYRAAMHAALETATTSDDPSTQNGAVIINEAGNILARGANNMPPGVETTKERLERPLKYWVREHAERSAIFAASSEGIALRGMTMVTPWAACSDCTRGIILSGIDTVVCYPWQYGGSHWDDDIATGRAMFREAGVNVVEDNFADLEIPVLRRNYEIWDPNA